MVDKTKALKQETPTDGTETDLLPTEMDPTEDYVSAKGMAYENSDDHLSHIVDNEVAFVDPVNGIKKVSDLISPAATETVPGVAEIATQAEVNAGTDDSRIVTPAKLAAYAGSGNDDFGKDFNIAEALTETSTTSLTFVQKLKLTTTSLEGGDYLVMVNAAFRSSSNNKGVELQIDIDDSNVIFTNQAKDEAYGQKGLIGRLVTLSAGVHTVDVDFRRVDGSVTAYLKEVSIILFKVRD